MAKAQSALQKAQGDIRWVKPQGFHLTFRFLGNIEQTRVAPILTALRAAVKLHPQFRVRTQGLGAFPSLTRPRVLWARLTGDGLQELHTKIESALGSCGFPSEDRAFRPHITLGRARSLRGWSQVLEGIKTYLQYDFGESLIDKVTLYQSDLRPGGAVYTPLGAAPLDPVQDISIHRSQQ
jgi:2'-5' RNA ligase